MQQPSYDGISHARLTRMMTQARLPPTARVLMAEIFRCIPIGTWRHISHDTFHRRLGISESTVSRGMALLDGSLIDDAGLPLNRTPFIQRRKRINKPGYEICPLPPPELRPKPAPRQPLPATTESASETPVLAAQMPLDGFLSPSISDPADPIPLAPIRTPENDLTAVVMSDPPIILDHACSGSSMRADTGSNPEPDRTTIEDRATTPAHDLPPAPPRALVEMGLLAHQWRALLAVAPAGYSAADCARDVMKLRTRHDVRSVFAVLKRSLQTGDPIYSQAEIAARQAELAALYPPKEVPDGETRPLRSADGASGRSARRGPERPRRAEGRDAAPRPAITREEWNATPFVDLAALGVDLSLPGGRRDPDRPEHSPDSPADHHRPLRE